MNFLRGFKGKARYVFLLICPHMTTAGDVMFNLQCRLTILAV